MQSAVGGLCAQTAETVRALFVSYKPSAANESKHFGHGALAVTDADYNRIRFLCKVLFNKMYR